MKNILHRSFTNNTGNKLVALSIAVLVLIIGYVFLQSRAAGFFASLDPASASLNGNAKVVTDVDGTKAIQFSTSSTTPPPTTPPPTTPPPSGGSSCPLPKYPSPSCTGVPAGTNFIKTVNGDYTVTTPGQVIDGWNITGSLIIWADNTTVKNSQIGGTVTSAKGMGGYDVYFSFTITDSTVGPASGCIPSPGVGESKYTATRVYVRGHDDGFRMSGPGNVTVQDSFARLCYLPPEVVGGDGSHSDGVQAVCGDESLEGPCSGLTFRHNTIDARGVPTTSMLNLVDTHLDTVTAKDNMLAGGGYVMHLKWQGGPNWIVQGNHVVDQSWAYGPVDASSKCANYDWSGNTIVTTDSSYNITSTVRTIACN